MSNIVAKANRPAYLANVLSIAKIGGNVAPPPVSAPAEEEAETQVEADAESVPDVKSVPEVESAAQEVETVVGTEKLEEESPGDAEPTPEKRDSVSDPMPRAVTVRTTRYIHGCAVSTGLTVNGVDPIGTRDALKIMGKAGRRL